MESFKEFAPFCRLLVWGYYAIVTCQALFGHGMSFAYWLYLMAIPLMIVGGIIIALVILAIPVSIFRRVFGFTKS